MCGALFYFEITLTFRIKIILIIFVVFVSFIITIRWEFSFFSFPNLSCVLFNVSFQWKRLDMSPVEQREVICFTICLVFTIVCVSWFLYKLSPGEIQRDVLGWWIKLIFDAIGFIAALILMCIKGKVCGKLFRSWRAFNSIIYVQNAPEKEGTDLQQAVRVTFFFF